MSCGSSVAPQTNLYLLWKSPDFNLSAVDLSLFFLREKKVLYLSVFSNLQLIWDLLIF